MINCNLVRAEGFNLQPDWLRAHGTPCLNKPEVARLRIGLKANALTGPGVKPLQDQTVFPSSEAGLALASTIQRFAFEVIELQVVPHQEVPGTSIINAKLCALGQPELFNVVLATQQPVNFLPQPGAAIFCGANGAGVFYERLFFERSFSLLESVLR